MTANDFINEHDNNAKVKHDTNAQAKHDTKAQVKKEAVLDKQATSDKHTINEGSGNEGSKDNPTDISHIHTFLGVNTDQKWLQAAVDDLPTIIQDHANCEKKAAGTAMTLIFKYEFHRELQLKLAQLIREEMLHYEQVVNIMQERGQPWQYLSASRYAQGLLKHKRTHEPAAMIDVLIIGAFIEARSCERFAALANVIDDERLAKYYRYLLKSESRHYEDYLTLAHSLKPYFESGDASEHLRRASINLSDDVFDIDQRVGFFKAIEAELINSPDSQLRFHSGIPIY